MLRSSTVKITTERGGKYNPINMLHTIHQSITPKTLTLTTGTTAVSGWYPKENKQVAVAATVRSVERVKADYQMQDYLLDLAVEHLVIRRVNYWFAAKQMKSSVILSTQNECKQQ